MNKTHLGSNIILHINEAEKKHPGLRTAIDEHKEKALLAQLLRQIREVESLTQEEMAQKTGVTQSIIARMESPAPRYVPSMSLFNRIVTRAGYRLKLTAEKKGRKLHINFSQA
jgi:DNA-binding XRE family transcriptional regulator